jgi:hypothetical protein
LTHRRLLRLVALLAIAFGLFVVTGTAPASTLTREIPSGGTFLVPNAPAPVAGPLTSLELRPGATSVDSPVNHDVQGPRGGPGGPKPGPHGPHGGPGGGPAPGLAQSFDGLNFFDSRFANGGNQFSGEPPDQGLCVGNGKVVEIVNDVYQVFDMHGHPLTNPIDVNTLFGYPAAINRTTGAIGPELFDPSCLYDSQTNTFFVDMAVLDMNPDGTPTGGNHLDILVGSDPTSSFTGYSIDTSGALPGCPGGCELDYPHIGADANGLYATIDVFDFAGGYDGVAIYALPKALLATRPASVPVTEVDTNGVGPSDDGGQFYAVIPAVSPASNQFASSGNGTEYFSSSRAVFTDSGVSNSLNVLTLSNTNSLTSATPSLHLANSTFATEQYSVPAPPVQKKGPTPLADCAGSMMKIPALNAPCWLVVASSLGITQPTKFQENVLDGNDSVVGGVSYAAGKLWITLGSAATDSHNQPFDGAAWFVINPSGPHSGLMNQGMLVQDGTNLTYPSIAATANGSAALAFTIVGPHDFPSAGYAGLDAKKGTSDVRFAQHGTGPQDGFSEYAPYFSDGSPRPRWGDYSASVADGNSIWIASEYIGQKCDLHQYVEPSPSNAAAFGTCGDTRGALGNWDTRISQLQPMPGGPPGP